MPALVMTDAPLVSIVTPSYNQGQFIEETLQSVRMQDYQNIEHIIIDGSSTDDTLSVLRRYESTYNMRWISEPDKNHAEALCKGFRQARGHILAWLNSDDLYLPGAISQAVAAFREHPSADLIYGDVIIIDGEGEEIGRRRLTRMDAYDFLGQGNCLAQPATFWTRDIYDRVGGIDSTYYFQMDLEYFIRVASAGRLQHVRSWLAKIRIHPEGKMVKAEHIRRQELAELQQRYMTTAGVRRLFYTRPFLLSRLFVHFALQGDLEYAGGKVWRRILDGQLFRESRR